MTKKKIETIDEFDALSVDEQNEVLDEIKSKLGDAQIDMRMYVPEALRVWWENKVATDPGGRLAIEMLMSNFLISSLAVAINEGEQAFTTKTALAQAILVNPVKVRNGKIYLGVNSGSSTCNEDCNPCTCDDCDDHGGGNDEGQGQTFH